MGGSLAQLAGRPRRSLDAGRARRAAGAARRSRCPPRSRSRRAAWRCRAGAALAAYLWAWLENQAHGGDQGGAARPGRRAAPARHARARASRGRRTPRDGMRRRRVRQLRARARASRAPRTRRSTRGCSAPRTSLRPMPVESQPLRVGIGGPVGSGKTALTLALCRALRDRYEHRRRHQRHLHRGGRAVPRAQRGAARPSASSAWRPAAARTRRSARTPRSTSRRSTGSRARFPSLDIVFVESGGDNLAATFSPELSDLTLYVIDVAAGDKIPRKGGPGITRSRPAGHQQDRPRAAWSAPRSR